MRVKPNREEILFRAQDAERSYTITFTGISGTDTDAATAQFIVK